MATVVQIPIAELVEDMDIYPRHAVDTAHVAGLVNSLKAGVQLPPIVVDKATKRIVDGWHRARAYARIHGPTATIDAELRRYKSEADLVVDAVQLNAAHGRKLDAIDHVRVVLMLERLDVKPMRIALAMHIPEERVTKLRVRFAKAEHASDTAVPGTQKIVLKRPVAHLQNRTLNDEQVRVHQGLPGTSFILIARQLSDALKAKMVDLADAKLVSVLQELRAVLELEVPQS